METVLSTAHVDKRVDKSVNGLRNRNALSHLAWRGHGLTNACACLRGKRTGGAAAIKGGFFCTVVIGALP
jgi:hypothetical protein